MSNADTVSISEKATKIIVWLLAQKEKHGENLPTSAREAINEFESVHGVSVDPATMNKYARYLNLTLRPTRSKKSNKEDQSKQIDDLSLLLRETRMELSRLSDLVGECSQVLETLAVGLDEPALAKRCRDISTAAHGIEERLR